MRLTWLLPVCTFAALIADGDPLARQRPRELLHQLPEVISVLDVGDGGGSAAALSHGFARPFSKRAKNARPPSNHPNGARPDPWPVDSPPFSLTPSQDPPWRHFRKHSCRQRTGDLPVAIPAIDRPSHNDDLHTTENSQNQRPSAGETEGLSRSGRWGYYRLDLFSRQSSWAPRSLACPSTSLSSTRLTRRTASTTALASQWRSTAGS